MSPSTVQVVSYFLRELAKRAFGIASAKRAVGALMGEVTGNCGNGWR